MPVAARAQDKMSVTTHDTDIVSSIRWAIAGAIGNDRFELWFADTQIEVDHDRVLVEAANEFTVDWLRTNFRRAIEAACAAVMKTEANVLFRVRTGAESRPSPPPCTKGSNGRPADPSGENDRTRGPARRRCATFESLVVGAANRIAATAAQMVATEPGRVSPLFLYGPTGVGKTHLLEGVWNCVRRRPEQRRCTYLTAEQFTTCFLDALHGRGLPTFRRRYREVDLLIVEDVQFFAGKQATVNELLYTIDALLRDGGQLCFSADRSPADLTALGTDLVNRFCGGLVSYVEPPDHDIRLEILRRESRARGLGLTDDVLEMLAARMSGDCRKLIGAVNRLDAVKRAWGKPITLAVAVESLRELLHAPSRQVQLKDIERAVCDKFGLEPATLKSSAKVRSITNPRMLAMWLAREHTRAALSEIGDYFGRRSHSTVISAHKKVNRWVKDGAEVRITHTDYRVDQALRELQAKLQVG
jgi:chromosomal replication initiator protein